MSRKSTVPTSSDNYDGLKDYLHNLVLTSEEEANIPGQLKFLYAQCAFLTSSEERQGVERLLDRELPPAQLDRVWRVSYNHDQVVWRIPSPQELWVTPWVGWGAGFIGRVF